MYCRICGTEENVAYHAAQRQALCRDCKRDTPPKVSRAAFDLAYWKREDGTVDPSDPPEGIRREFYEDYLASSDTLARYIVATSEPC